MLVKAHMKLSLKVRNLSYAVTSRLQPETITVTIEKKVTKTFDVETVVPSGSTHHLVMNWIKPRLIQMK